MENKENLSVTNSTPPENPVPETSPEKPKTNNSVPGFINQIPPKYLIVLIFILIPILMALTAIIIKGTASQNAKVNPSALAPTPTAQPSPTIAAMPSPTLSPILNSVSPTPIITTIPANTPTPAPNQTTSDTGQGTPGSPPPATNGPPDVTISYPSDGQSITMDSTQTFCVVDVPQSNTDGLQRKQNTGGGWTGYAAESTLCYSPSEGANTLQLQYKNSGNYESPVYTVNFTFHRTN